MKMKITAKFRASKRLLFEDTKGIMSLEMRPKSHGAFKNRAPGDVFVQRVLPISANLHTVSHEPFDVHTSLRALVIRERTFFRPPFYRDWSYCFPRDYKSSTAILASVSCVLINQSADI